MSNIKIKLLAIAKSWAMKNISGWDDLSHRDLIARHGASEIEGRISSKTMSEKQLVAALEDYHARGWPQHRKSARTLDTSPSAQKIRALWLELHACGAVRNSSEAALGAYVKRQTGVSALQWLNDAQTVTVIESLKKWLKRLKKE